MAQSYEIEIKSLLGSRENADAFRSRLLDSAHGARLTGTNKQLNHYFVPGDMAALAVAVAPHVAAEHRERLVRSLEDGKNHSIRTRQRDAEVLFVAKASVDDTTSANGIMRMEFEESVDLTLDELDQVLLAAGCTYQAKWSREREEYAVGDTAVCLDRNAGYGYLAEFGRVVGPDEDMVAVRDSLRLLMDDVGAVELAQDRLERMFAFYNTNWRDYYGTENVFTVE